MDFSDSIFEEFMAESREHLESMEDDILLLKGGAGSKDRTLIDDIFRSIHSIKGAAGFLSLSHIEQLTHVMETVLSLIRSDQMRPDRAMVDALLNGVDFLNIMLEDVTKSDDVDISQVCKDLLDLMETSEAGVSINEMQREEVHLMGEKEEGICFSVNHLKLKNLPSTHEYLYILKYDLSDLSKEKGKSPVSLVRDLLEFGEIVEGRIQPLEGDLYQGLPGDHFLFFIIFDFLSPDQIAQTLHLSGENVARVNKGDVNGEVCAPSELMEESVPWISLGDDDPKEIVTDSTPEKQVSGKPEEEQKESGVPKKTDQMDIRIHIEKLDLLVNLVGELVIAESMVTGNSDLVGLELENFDHSARNLRRIISELQDVAMSMRMIPLSQTFRTMTRLVHDLSEKLGKKCRLEVIGQETELDKTVIQQISDPLRHIVRNCLDHGIESPEERKAKGKPETGTIRMEAGHLGGEVHIRITDDGCGLDRDQILARGITMGLVKPGTEAMDDKAVYQLLFNPGFSTSEKVTDISGRGVGLDVVQKNLERLKGRAEIRTAREKGTAITLKIPLTMAIIEGMLVRVGPSVYTIPILSIRESFRPSSEQITETMNGQEIVKIRDDLIPVIRLHELYNVIPERYDLSKGILINVTSGGESVCIFADEIMGHHQTVIKRVPKYVASARGVSGCTILSDGEVSLILDIGKIISMSETSTE